MTSRGQLLRFGVIGCIGFAIDGGLLTLLTVLVGVNIYLARLISFLLATLATWQLNRKHTFAMTTVSDKRLQVSEYARYFLVQVAGGLINLSIFAWLIFMEPQLRSLPILPLAMGAGAGLVWNYAGARLWVYRR